MAKGSATKDASNDESCNEMRKHRGKRETKKNQQTMEYRLEAMKSEHRSQITKNQILKTKTSRDYRRQTNDEEDNIKDD